MLNCYQITRVESYIKSQICLFLTFINIEESTNNDPATATTKWTMFTEGTNSASLVTQNQLKAVDTRALGYAITFGL